MKHERVRLGDCYKFKNKLNYTASPCLKNYKTNNKKINQKMKLEGTWKHLYYLTMEINRGFPRLIE